MSGASRAAEAGSPTEQCVVCLGQDDWAAAARLRGVAGVKVCTSGDAIWLRIDVGGESLDRRLRALPGARRFTVLADGQLLAPGARVPQGRVPPGPWVGLAGWLEVELPPAAFAGQWPRGVAFRLVRSTESEASPVRSLLTTMRDWLAYASEAPSVRLDRLRFAATEDGRVLVLGEPLPPIAGQRLVEHDGLVVPAGWAWLPAVDAPVVRRLLGLKLDDRALLHPDGTFEQIAGDDLATATRAAVRATAEEMARGSR
jgi:hypothetical protein